MSAIAGIYYRDGRPVERRDLQRMVDRVAHRGPDGASIWSEGAVGLGHRMLWTTPESLHEQLPLVRDGGALAITADARIDNRGELIALLGLADRPAGDIGDSELILAAYERWGEHCPEKLLGDFAFAIWDNRRRALFCARDHFGIKPFYYYAAGNMFVFGSEIKSILCMPEVPQQLSELRVVDHLAMLSDDTAITFYQDIVRLLPSHSLLVTPKGMYQRRYWSLDPSRELRLGSNREYAEAFREIFTEAVRCRLRSAFPVGSLLSGGLDSSSITCVARDLLAQRGAPPLDTFSLQFDEVTQCSEMPYVNAVLAQGGIKPHFVHGDRIGPWVDIERVHWHLDEVISGGNTFLLWELHKHAHTQGMRIVLDGFDGDTTVSHGTGYFIELARAGRWIKLAREASGYAKHFKESPRKVVWTYVRKYGLNPIIPKAFNPIRPIPRAILRQLLHPTRPKADRPLKRSFINACFSQRMHEQERRRAFHKSGYTTEREVHYLRLTAGILQHILDGNNNLAAAFSTENRYPFWDRRLVEFCLALPPEQKLDHGWNRMVMRRAMNGILPKEVQWRGGKINMSPNFERGLRTFERERLQDALFENAEIIQEYGDVVALRGAHERFLNQEATERDILAIWTAASLGLWLQHTGLNRYASQERR